jgi:magnesium transporter
MAEQTPEDARERREDEYGLDPAMVDAVRHAVRAGDRAAVVAHIAGLHVADIADLLEQIDTEERRGLIVLAWADIDPAVLAELEEGVRDDVLRILEPAQVAEAARELDTDDVVYLVEDLKED